jgi:hypothetical protein
MSIASSPLREKAMTAPAPSTRVGVRRRSPAVRDGTGWVPGVHWAPSQKRSWPCTHGSAYHPAAGSVVVTPTSCDRSA